MIINAIRSLGPNSKDPLADPDVLTKAVKIGILDAPHLKGNKACKGTLNTRVLNGAMYAYDNKNKKVITEEERISKILKEQNIQPESILNVI